MAYTRVNVSKIGLPLEVPTHLNTQKTLAHSWIDMETQIEYKGQWRMVRKMFLFLKGDATDQAFVTQRVIEAANECAGKRLVVLELDGGECIPIYDVTGAKYEKREEVV